MPSIPWSVPFRVSLAPTLFGLASLSAQVSSPVPSPSETERGAATVHLSPFTVNADADEGWQATSTLAGSRMNTPLRDTGASISVLTSEFLQDIGAIDLTEAIGYSVNMHIDTMEANATSENTLQFNFDTQRMSIRGLPATSTRNYYRWQLQSDAYTSTEWKRTVGPIRSSSASVRLAASSTA